MDVRENQDGDLLIYHRLGDNDFVVAKDRYSVKIGVTTTKTIASLYEYAEFARPARIYFFNFSAMQHRLYARLTGSAE